MEFIGQFSAALSVIELLFILYQAYYQWKNQKQEVREKFGYKCRLLAHLCHVSVVLMYLNLAAERLGIHRITIFHFFYFFSLHLGYKFLETWLTKISRKELPVKTYVRLVTIVFALTTVWDWFMGYHCAAKLFGYDSGPPDWAQFFDQFVGAGLAGFWAYENTFTWETAPVQNFPHHAIASLFALQSGLETPLYDKAAAYSVAFVIIFEVPFNFVMLLHKISGTYTVERATQLTYTAYLWGIGSIFSCCCTLFFYFSIPKTGHEFVWWIPIFVPLLVFALVVAQWMGLQNIFGMIRYVRKMALKKRG